MIRVCPKRDAECPHGMDCPFMIDRGRCKPEPGERDYDAETETTYMTNLKENGEQDA